MRGHGGRPQRGSQRRTGRGALAAMRRLGRLVSRHPVVPVALPRMTLALPASDRTASAQDLVRWQAADWASPPACRASLGPDPDAPVAAAAVTLVLLTMLVVLGLAI